MSETPDKRGKKPLVIAITVVVVFGLLTINSRSREFWDSIQPTFSEVDIWLALASTTLLAGGLLFSLRRSSWLLALFLVTAITNFGLGILLNHVDETFPIVLHYLLYTVQSVTGFGVVIPVGILMVVRFKGKLDRVRIGAIIAVCAVPLSRLFAYWINNDLWDYMVLFGSAFTSLLLIFAAWCLAFYSLRERHRPPADTGRVVSMTCPRCSAAITIPTGHGDCPHCRMQISISLEEGACSKCHYPLRGLTGDRCPECGEAIVQPAMSVAESPLGTETVESRVDGRVQNEPRA